jgi:proline dehydrogenase
VGITEQVLRPAILRVAEAPWFRQLAVGSAPGRALAARFVAGDTLADAVAAGRELGGTGISTMLSHLGEHVRSPADALVEREACLAELAAAEAADELDVVIAVKPTQLGLDDSVETCWAMLEPVLAEAERTGTTVMIDMESHDYVDRTLEILARTHARWPRSGVAIQSYLRRSAEDVFALPEGCRVRLVKGAYLEPREVVHTSKREVDGAYRRLFSTVLARGHRVDVATHDPAMIDGVKARVDAVADGWSRVEFQMLYGVRRDLQEQLATQGYPVRVSIPYGTEWYPYLTRRLAERPANMWFFLSNLMRT